MNKEIVEKLEKFTQDIQDFMVERKTLLKQKEEAELAIKELCDKCKEEFDLSPDELKNKIEGLTKEVENLFKDLQAMLEVD